MLTNPKETVEYGKTIFKGCQMRRELQMKAPPTIMGKPQQLSISGKEAEEALNKMKNGKADVRMT